MLVDVVVYLPSEVYTLDPPIPARFALASGTLHG